LFFAGQTVFGWLNYNDEKDAHYQPQIGFVQSLGLEPSARLSSKSAAVSEDSLLERVTAAPRRRHKSGAGPGKRITNMNYGDRLRDTVIPEMQGMRKDAACRQFPGRRVSSRVIVDFKGKSAVASPPKNPIFPVPLLLRATPGGKGSSQPLASHKPRVQSNDIVEFDNQPGTWKVVAPVNGSKADVRRSEGFDTRIVTARLESLIVVRRAGSPGYSY
jgi:hypothetical protein